MDLLSDGQSLTLVLEEYSKLAEDDSKVQILDPLSLDDFFISRLTELNKDRRTADLKKDCNALRLRSSELKSLSIQAAMAATRDLAMIASSCQRHAIPFGEIPALEAGLLQLAEITGELPTDTVTTYGTRNPCGVRMRVFTHLAEEHAFIESFRAAMAELPRCLRALHICQCLSVFDPSCSEYLIIAREKFKAMVKAIISIKKVVTPEIFTHELRPYFDPKIIGGKRYFAPGGAQMPIILIDQAIWAMNSIDDGILKGYYEENISYQPALLRRCALLFQDKACLIHKITAELSGSQVSDGGLVFARQSLDALGKLIAIIAQFRAIHLGIARENMAIRPVGSIGSGGYDIKILERLLFQTLVARRAISSLMELTRKKPRH